MENVHKIEDDLYYVQHPTRPGWFCGITVVVGADSLGLVDTGYANTPEEYLLPFLEEIGRSPQEITTVYNTHGDGDHIEGNAAVKKLSGAQFACYTSEAEAIRNVDLSLSDGQTIALGDRTFTVIHCPGHRQGNSCLFDKESSLLIAGDTIVGTRRELIRIGTEPYVASLRRILNLSPATVVMSHPFDPAGKNVLRGAEISAMVEASITIAQSGA
ncbi:MAG: MBL fold metallo-hydrolase [Spirochaetales bacterium]|nr:MBL fold metallo-hydrolase [Spirochaetales bacterium]